MSDDSTQTITGVFASREQAERAVERLVQEHGVDRADIFVAPADGANSAGTRVSGGDAARAEPEYEPPLRGAVSLSADLSPAEVEAAERTLRQLEASDVRRG